MPISRAKRGAVGERRVARRPPRPRPRASRGRAARSAGRWARCPGSGPPLKVPLIRHWTSHVLVVASTRSTRHLDVRDGGEQLGEEGLDLVGAAEDADRQDVLDRLGGPVLGHGLGVARDDGVEVGERDSSFSFRFGGADVSASWSAIEAGSLLPVRERSAARGRAAPTASAPPSPAARTTRLPTITPSAIAADRGGLLRRRDAEADRHGHFGGRAHALHRVARARAAARRARRSCRPATRCRRSRARRAPISREPLVGRRRRHERHERDARGVAGARAARPPRRGAGRARSGRPRRRARPRRANRSAPPASTRFA